MAITFFFTEEITKIKRIKQRGGIKSVLSATGTACPCSIQQDGLDANQQFEGDIGEEYSVFVDPACIARKGDQVVIENILYEVRAHDIVDPAWASESYKELTIVKKARYGS
jgi:hypothetical protein